MSISELAAAFKAVTSDIEAHLEEISRLTYETSTVPWGGGWRVPVSDYWNNLPPEAQDRAHKLAARLLPLCAQLAAATKTFTLTGPEDVHDVRYAAKAIRAALHLRRFRYSQTEVMHDEGTVLGVRHAEQDESEGIPPKDAQKIFAEQISIITRVIRLIEADETAPASSRVEIAAQGGTVVPGTAFIMMWMDPNEPTLDDVVTTVKDVFKQFGIRAQRADDIEHDGLITDRIRAEIRSAEFLFADLSGTRPNVYYEVGYAHALGKRVMLYRRADTKVHFDLAGYNCPDYRNLGDLRNKLSKRLEEMTGKYATEPKAL